MQKILKISMCLENSIIKNCWKFQISSFNIFQITKKKLKSLYEKLSNLVQKGSTNYQPYLQHRNVNLNYQWIKIETTEF